MTWTTFANLTGPTLPELDANLSILTYLAPVACTVSGTNTLTLTVANGGTTIAAYQQNMTVTAIAAATNTGGVTAQFGSLAALTVYKDTPQGPIALTGGEIVQNCALTLWYDSALASGSGGFHLQNPTNRFSTLATITYTASILPGGAVQNTIALAGTAVNDIISLGLPAAPPASIGFSAYVSAAGSIVLRASNLTPAATITPNATLVFRVADLGTGV